MLFTPALALTEAALPPLNLTAPLQLLGPANSRPAQPGLDLTARQRPLFAIGGDGLIYVRHMVSTRVWWFRSTRNGACTLAGALAPT